MECVFKRGSTKSEAVVTIKRADMGIYAYQFNGAYVTIEGTSYRKAETVTVPVGTVITLHGAAYGKSDDPGTVSVYVGGTLIYQEQASGKKQFEYDYMVSTDITVRLQVTGTSSDYDTVIKILETAE